MDRAPAEVAAEGDFGIPLRGARRVPFDLARTRVLEGGDPESSVGDADERPMGISRVPATTARATQFLVFICLRNVRALIGERRPLGFNAGLRGLPGTIGRPANFFRPKLVEAETISMIVQSPSGPFRVFLEVLEA